MGFANIVDTLLQDDCDCSVTGIAEDRRPALQTETQDDPVMAERTRIAQELHDTLLQGFFAVFMHLHTAVERLPADSPAKQQLTHVLGLTERTLEQGRCAVEGLRSPRKHAGSLGKALAGVPDDLCLPPSVGFRVMVHGEERELSGAPFEDVYRIGREAILNAYRHSRAKLIEAEIDYRTDELRIAVRDNGCGIDAEELHRRQSRHWGLSGMRERAERIGARLSLLSGVALGTEVELLVPNRVAFAPSR
jgi:signal transduction histidine kinase